MKKNLIVDCFAGGGGASVGIEMALGRPVDIAINHDPDAILISFFIWDIELIKSYGQDKRITFIIE